MNTAPLSDAIRAFGTAKQVARVVRCSEATAARYRRGETLPDLVSLARLMGRSRPIAAALFEMAGLGDLTLAFEEAWLGRELRALQARRGSHHVPRPANDYGANDNQRAEPARMTGGRSTT